MTSTAELDRAIFKPIYHQLAERLRADVASGRLSHGVMIPKEEELCQIHSVSRSTVRGALRELERDGLVRRVKGRGTFITPASNSLAAPPVIVIGQTTGLGHHSIQGLVVGALERAQRDGALVKLLPCGELESAFDAARKGRPAGVILTAPAGYPTDCVAAFEKRGIPYIVEFNKDPLLNHIDLDNRAAMRKVVDHLFTLGHRHFALCSIDDQENFHYAERCAATAERLAELGIPLDSSRQMLIPEGRQDDVDVYDVWGPVFARPDAPTAMICSSDNCAAALLRWLGRRGISVPADVSVTGFDDSDFCRHLDPPLTTVFLDYYKLGFEAADHVISMIHGKSPSRTHHLLDLKLIVRGSTGPAHEIPGRQPGISTMRRKRK